MSADTESASTTVVASNQAYGQLASLELEFEQAECELLKQQIALLEPLYARRHAVLSNIPSFWTIIFENFGPELDEHITTDDWAFLGENLISLNVTRPDPSNSPHSFEITFGLKKDNGVIDATEIRKRFIHKSLRDGKERWTGLISEPVEIKWVGGDGEDKDLTGGINRLAMKIFELRKKRVERSIEEKKGKLVTGKSNKVKVDDGLAELELELEEKLNQTQSLFNWFSWTGDYLMVLEQEAEVDRNKANGGKGEDEEEDDNDEEEDQGIDVFPDGEKLALLIAEDMFPNALKHFADAMENNDLADGDSDNEDGVDYDDAESIELDSDIEEQLMRGNMKLGKGAKLGGKKKRKSDDEMEDEDEEEARGKKKARK